MIERLIAAVAALGLLCLNGAQAAENTELAPLFESDVIGSVPGLAIGGVPSAGAGWVVRGGEVSIAENGMLHLEVAGLLIAPGSNLSGTTGPVTAVAASLVCGGSGGAIAVSTSAAPLTAGGNAKIRQAIALPPSCFAPSVLVRIFNPTAAVGSQLGPFVAASGLLH